MYGDILLIIPPRGFPPLGFKELINLNKNSILKRAVECIDISINNGYKEIHVYRIQGVLDYFIDEENFEDILETARMYFEDLEDYEECSRILDLKGRLEFIGR